MKKFLPLLVVIEDLSYTGDTDKTDVFVYNNGKLEKQ